MNEKKDTLVQLPYQLQGADRRYHLDSVVDSNEYGRVYRAFSRFRRGRKLIRRYYAVVLKNGEADDEAFRSFYEQSLAEVPVDVHEEDVVETPDGIFHVVAPGRAVKKPSPFYAVTNKGFLMIILAGLILFLVIKRLS